MKRRGWGCNGNDCRQQPGLNADTIAWVCLGCEAGVPVVGGYTQDASQPCGPPKKHKVDDHQARESWLPFIHRAHEMGEGEGLQGTEGATRNPEELQGKPDQHQRPCRAKDWTSGTRTPIHTNTILFSCPSSSQTWPRAFVAKAFVGPQGLAGHWQILQPVPSQTLPLEVVQAHTQSPSPRLTLYSVDPLQLYAHTHTHTHTPLD